MTNCQMFRRQQQIKNTRNRDDDISSKNISSEKMHTSISQCAPCIFNLDRKFRRLNLFSYLLWCNKKLETVKKNICYREFPFEFLANQCQPIGPMWADWPALFSRYLKRQGLSKEFHSERDTLGSIAQKGHSRISARNFSFGLKNSGGICPPCPPL